MITSILKTAAINAGCEQIFYESDKLSGVITDQSQQDKILCLILQTNSLKLKVISGMRERYPAVIIEIMKQVKMEDTAENNETTLDALLVVCKSFIYYLIESGSFSKITEVPVEKIQESRYDANFLGWSMSLDLNYIQNSDQCE